MKKISLILVTIIVFVSMLMLGSCGDYVIYIGPKPTSDSTTTNATTPIVTKPQPTTTTTASTTTTAPAPDTYEAMDLFNTNLSPYIMLGDYKGLTIEVNQLEVSAEEVEFYIQQVLAIDGEYNKVREGVITEKLVFNFDYTGYLLKADGTKDKAFDGGAGTNQLAYIEGDTLYTLSSSGVGSFIDGFAQGILGHSVGETFDIQVTFPEDYQSADLKGKTVIFEIKLNHISQGNFTDGWVKEYTNDEHKTCDEYREYVTGILNDSLKDSRVAIMWETIINNSVIIEIPEQEYNYWYYTFRDEVEYYVMMYQMYGYSVTYEDMLLQFGFENDAALRKYAEEIVIEELVIFAVIKAEGIEATDEEYRILLDSLIEQTGKTEEEVLKQYSEEVIREQIIFNKLDDIIYNLNIFVQK